MRFSVQCGRKFFCGSTEVPRPAAGLLAAKRILMLFSVFYRHKSAPFFPVFAWSHIVELPETAEEIAGILESGQFSDFRNSQITGSQQHSRVPHLILCNHAHKIAMMIPAGKFGYIPGRNAKRSGDFAAFDIFADMTLNVCQYAVPQVAGTGTGFAGVLPDIFERHLEQFAQQTFYRPEISFVIELFNSVYQQHTAIGQRRGCCGHNQQLPNNHSGIQRAQKLMPSGSARRGGLHLKAANNREKAFLNS